MPNKVLRFIKKKNVHNRNPLKVTVEGEADVKLYPEDDEPVNILNIKRGIVSALMVPMIEEEMTKNTVSNNPIVLFSHSNHQLQFKDVGLFVTEH